MKTLRDSVYVLVAVGSLAMAVCQPSEAGAEHASQAVDHVVSQLSDAFQPVSAESIR